MFLDCDSNFKIILFNFLISFIPVILSFFINDVVKSIGIISSLLCPVFIIILPSQMNLQLSKDLELSDFETYMI